MGRNVEVILKLLLKNGSMKGLSLCKSFFLMLRHL